MHFLIRQGRAALPKHPPNGMEKISGMREGDFLLEQLVLTPSSTLRFITALPLPSVERTDLLGLLREKVTG